MKLSIIIPTYNEEASIGKLLRFLLGICSSQTELIVADGGSTDATGEIVKELNIKLLHCASTGRAPQMNEAALVATGDVLYFLHADTFPPVNFERTIEQAITAGFSSGCFRLKFDLEHWFLKANAWFTRFNVDAIRFGDQSLFVKKDAFIRVGGFNEKLLLLEDQEIVIRLKKAGKFIVLPDEVTTSARKYQDIGIYKLQSGYFLIYTLYRLGIKQEQLVRVYKWLLHNKK